LAGFFSLLPWTVSGAMAGVLLGSWFGGEIKKRLDGANQEGKETKVVRFRKKAELEDNVSEMRAEGWEPRWESYRETQTGVSCSPDRLLGCNGEEATKTTGKRVQARFETFIPGQAALFADLNLDFPRSLFE